MFNDMLLAILWVRCSRGGTDGSGDDCRFADGVGGGVSDLDAVDFLDLPTRRKLPNEGMAEIRQKGVPAGQLWTS